MKARVRSVGLVLVVVVFVALIASTHARGATIDHRRLARLRGRAGRWTAPRHPSTVHGASPQSSFSLLDKGAVQSHLTTLSKRNILVVWVEFANTEWRLWAASKTRTHSQVLTMDAAKSSLPGCVKGDAKAMAGPLGVLEKWSVQVKNTGRSNRCEKAVSTFFGQAVLLPLLTNMGWSETNRPHLAFVLPQDHMVVPWEVAFINGKRLVELATTSYVPQEQGKIVVARERDMSKLHAIFFAGTDTFAPGGYSPLPYVDMERSQLETYAKQHRVEWSQLWKSSFTREKLLASDGFRPRNDAVVHIATHGQNHAFIDFKNKEITAADVTAVMARSPHFKVVNMNACNTANMYRPSKSLSANVYKATGSDVLATFWAVNDLAAALIAEYLYSEMLEHGKSPVDALAISRRRMLATPLDSHPYFWAPFILLGI